MPTINIEDQFWIDVLDIAKHFSSKHEAIGQVICFWQLCQLKYKQGRAVTSEEYARAGLSEALFPVFAENVDGGIMAVGADEKFMWLRKKVIAGSLGGLASAESRAETALKHEQSDTYKQALSSTSKHSEPLCLSFPLKKELNTVQTSTQPDVENFVDKPQAQPAGRKSREPKSGKLWELFRECFKRKRSYEPPRTAKGNAALCRLIDTYGQETSEKIVRHYFRMQDKYYKTQCWPPEILGSQHARIYGSLMDSESKAKSIPRPAPTEPPLFEPEMTLSPEEAKAMMSKLNWRQNRMPE